MTRYHYTFQEIQASAQHHWTHILTSIGIPNSALRNKHQPCPLCGGKDRYRYDNKNGQGTYFCNQCGAGDGFCFVQKHLGLNTYGQAVAIVAQLLNMNETQSCPIPTKSPVPHNTPTPKDELTKITRLWQSGQPIANTPAQYYLQQRGIQTISGSLDIRFLPKLAYWHNRQRLGDFPALIGAFHNLDGEITGVQRIYLTQNQQGQWQKATLRDPQTGKPLDAKKMLSRYSGSTAGSAIRLNEANGEILLIAEGIESAFAARELLAQLPTWASVSAGNMARLALPPHIKRLIIAADHDSTGQKAAHHLALNAIQQGIQVQIFTPEKAGNDPLDELNRRKHRAYQILQNLPCEQQKQTRQAKIWQQFINQ